MSLRYGRCTDVRELWCADSAIGLASMPRLSAGTIGCACTSPQTAPFTAGHAGSGSGLTPARLESTGNFALAFVFELIQKATNVKFDGFLLPTILVV